MTQRIAWVIAVGVAATVLITAAQAPHGEYFDAQVLLGAARSVVAGGDPYGTYFQSPLWTALLLTPFTLMPEDAGYLAWFWVNVACWGVAAWLLLEAAGWPPTRPARFAVACVLCTFPPVVWSTHGQVLSFMALGMALFLRFAASRPVVAGAALALLLVKPHLALVPLALLALCSCRSGRPRVLIGLTGAGLVLLIVSLTVQPAWPLEWVREVINPPVEVVVGRARFAPTVAGLVGVQAVAVLIALAALAAAGRRLWDDRPPVETVAVAVVAMFLVTPYSQGYDLSLLVFSFAWALSRGSRVAIASVAGVYLFPMVVAFTDWPQPWLLVCVVATGAAIVWPSLGKRRTPAGPEMHAGRVDPGPTEALAQ